MSGSLFTFSVYKSLGIVLMLGPRLPSPWESCPDPHKEQQPTHYHC